VSLEKPKQRRGFAAMDPAKRKAIASKGGKAARASGRAHKFTSGQAKTVGAKGGWAAHQSGRAHQFTREEAQAAGRKGGRPRKGDRV
jgi:general stress protein YciG